MTLGKLAGLQGQWRSRTAGWAGFTSSGQMGDKGCFSSKSSFTCPHRAGLRGSIPIFGRLALKAPNLPPRYIQEVSRDENTDAPLVQRGLTAGTLTKNTPIYRRDETQAPGVKFQ